MASGPTAWPAMQEASASTNIVSDPLVLRLLDGLEAEAGNKHRHLLPGLVECHRMGVTGELRDEKVLPALDETCLVRDDAAIAGTDDRQRFGPPDGHLAGQLPD